MSARPDREVPGENEVPRLWALTPVAPRVLREQVRDSLRDAILSATLPPGTRVGEAETATALGVSRTPVREAIRELVQEGLLAFVPHRGAVVVTVSDDEIAASYRVMSVLEEEAMSRAAVRLTPQDMEELHGMIDEIADWAKRGEFVAANNADVKFHAKIADVAQLGLLRRTWTTIGDLGRLTTTQLAAGQNAFPRYLEGVANLNRDLLRVLSLRDPRAAAEAGRSHLEAVHQLFLADLRAAPAPGEADNHEARSPRWQD